MKRDEFLKKYKINKVYSYHEEKDAETVTFGWVTADSGHHLVDVANSMVVSSISKSKKTLDSDRDWSAKEGNSAATLEDYKRYFHSLTGEDAADFISSWKGREAELEESRKRLNKRYREEEGAFLISLAELISDGKRFSKFGRVYKIVDVNT
jgi:hypothetical protein